LGLEVTDEQLLSAFSSYKSVQRARVVRDKRSGKSKGFGFVSIADPEDYRLAMKEMNGKYVGSRPIKLKKSNWKDRNLSSRTMKKIRKSGAIKPY
jgi:RNA recognition motif-containing protein